jgi:DNA-binding CsgD family transcriptional regulator
MNSISVAIILRNTLDAIGLRHIFASMFSVNASLLNAIENVDASNENYDLYFTDSETFVANLEFFLPRRSKIVLVTDSDLGSSFPSINIRLEESWIIDNIGSILHNFEQTVDSHNELSAREVEVLKLVATGFLNKEIADKLGISINTVLTHRKNISAKLGIRSASGLSVYAMMNGYISHI